MKKTISILMSIVILLSSLPFLPPLRASAAAEIIPADQYSGGTGTEADPYIISTPEQLMKLSVDGAAANGGTDKAAVNFYDGVFFKLGCDLVMNTGDSSVWSITPPQNVFRPIGLFSTQYNNFQGSFDGDGHTISGLYVNEIESVAVGGLFASLGPGAVVKNLAVVNSYIAGSSTAGTIAGTMKTLTGDPITISGVYCDTEVYSSNSHAGGIVGSSSAVSTNTVSYDVISSCFFSGSVTAARNAGGILGVLNGSSSSSPGHMVKIDNCLNTGSIDSDKTLSSYEAYIGGILGQCYVNSEIINCINTGSITASGGGSSRTGDIFGGSSNQPGCNITIRDNYYIGANDVGKVINISNYSHSTKVELIALTGLDATPNFSKWTKIDGFLMLPTACVSFVDTTPKTVWMQEGASIRIGDPAGLRFTAQVDLIYLTRLIAEYGEEYVRVGMLIVPSDMVTEGITTEALAGIKYLDIAANVFANTDTATTDGYYVFHAAVVGIRGANLRREFSACAYVRYKDADGNVVSTYSKFSLKDNSRSICEVALAALNDQALEKSTVYNYDIGGGLYSPYTEQQRNWLYGCIKR